MKVDNSWLRRALRDLSLYGQLGFYVVVPPVVLCLGAYWLKSKFNIGNWIIIVSIIVGLITAFVNIYTVCMHFLEHRAKDKKKVVNFRKHI